MSELEERQNHGIKKILVENSVADILNRSHTSLELFGKERSMSGLNMIVQAMPFGTGKIMTELFWNVVASLQKGCDVSITFQRTKIPDCFTDSDINTKL